MTFELLKGQRPSAFQEKVPEKYTGEYKYNRKIYRIKDINDITFLLNNTYSKKGKWYIGKIDGVLVKISFSIESSSSLCTKTQEELEKAYKEALKRLSER